MEAVSETMERPDGFSEECISNELVKRIRKLRWMGMEEEAEELQTKLRNVHQAEVLVSGPSDTD